jgi:hypothetical protein
MAITSVTKDGGYLIIVEDGITTRRSIVYEDTVCSLPPVGYEEVGIVYVDHAAGTMIVQYNGQTIVLEPDGGRYILVGGTRPFTGDQSMGNHNLTNIGELNLVPKASSIGAEGTIFYDSDDNHVYVATE